MGIYPPVLPPPDSFNLGESEKLKNMFKKHGILNHIHDETRTVNLPVEEKGILILDPESRTRIIDPHMERQLLSQYEMDRSSRQRGSWTKCGGDSIVAKGDENGYI